MSERKTARNKEVLDYKAMNKGKVTTPAKKPQIPEVLSISPVQLHNLSRENVTVSPSKLLPDDVKKERLLARLSALDEKHARLQERNELEMLKRQVEEKVAYIQDLEKSLSASGLTCKKGSDRKSKVDRKGKHTGFECFIGK
jgi:hypothetical protein